MSFLTKVCCTCSENIEQIPNQNGPSKVFIKHGEEKIFFGMYLETRQDPEVKDLRHYAKNVTPDGIAIQMKNRDGDEILMINDFAPVNKSNKEVLEGFLLLEVGKPITWVLRRPVGDPKEKRYEYESVKALVTEKKTATGFDVTISDQAMQILVHDPMHESGIEYMKLSHQNAYIGRESQYFSFERGAITVQDGLDTNDPKFIMKVVYYADLNALLLGTGVVYYAAIGYVLLGKASQFLTVDSSSVSLIELDPKDMDSDGLPNHDQMKIVLSDLLWALHTVSYESSLYAFGTISGLMMTHDVDGSLQLTSTTPPVEYPENVQYSVIEISV